MNGAFLKKYQDYCRSIELKDEILQMIVRPNETLEEYVERFQYNLQRSPYASLPLSENEIKTTLIKGMKEQWIETLSIMGKGDIYQENFADIINLYINSLRDNTRIKPTEHDMITRDSKVVSGGITHIGINNILEYFKTDILGTLSTHFDIMQAKKKATRSRAKFGNILPQMQKET